MSPYAGENGLPSRIAALVRGPQSLREDIADEIADHLACHEEDEPAADPAAAHAAAVRAFGNAEQVARELRAIHLGDLIMFQKITIAALVVIVAGMAATAYFSYQSSRQTAAQFAQTAERFDQMNQQLTTLVELQKAALPKALPMKEAPPPAPTPPPVQKAAESEVRLRLRCGIAPNDEPAVGWTIRIGNRPAGLSYVTDANGWIQTTPLSYGQYDLAAWEPRNTEEADGTRAGFATRLDLKPVQGDFAEMRVTVSDRSEREVSLKWPDGFSWDRSATSPGRIRFQTIGDTQVNTRGQPINLFGPSKITGLRPGRAKVLLHLPDVNYDDPYPMLPGEKQSTAREQKMEKVWFEMGEVVVAEPGIPIEVDMKYEPRDVISGLLYEGSRDKPLANSTLQVIFWAGKTTRFGKDARDLCCHQHLRTDAYGRFSTLALMGNWRLSPPSEQWHSPEAARERVRRIGVQCKVPGKQVRQFIWFSPNESSRVLTLADGSTFVELDTSQVGVAHVSLSEVEGLGASGRSANGAMALKPVRRRTDSGKPAANWRQEALECRPDATIDIALPAGAYSLYTSLPVTEREPDQAEIVLHNVYSTSPRIEIASGKITQVTLAIGDLKDWELKHSEWRRAGETQPATAPADHASTVGP